MTNRELIDKVIDIIKSNVRKEALGAYSCMLRGYNPLKYEKCINEIVKLIEEDNNDNKTEVLKAGGLCFEIFDMKE
ncbi:hypothetical protein ES703_18800 [subsurface metagenome]